MVLVVLAAIDSYLGNRINVPWPLLAADAVLGGALIGANRWFGARTWARWLIAAAPAISTAAAGPAALVVAREASGRRWRAVLPVCGVFTAALAANLHNPWTPMQPIEPRWVELLLVTAAVAALTAAAAYRGARVDLIRVLRERALDAEREQRFRMEKTRTEERNRIAREMHDVLAHRLTLISLNASTLTYRSDLAAADRDALAGEILANTRQSLAEVRGILSDLRSQDGEDEAAERPQPTFEELGQLFEDNRRAGVQLEVRDEVSGCLPAPPNTGRHAYRIVQEALTNARKHGAPGPVKVRIAPEGPNRILIEVRNRLGPVTVGAGREDAGVPRDGVGLVGLTERAAICGGSLHWSDAGDEFELRVRLPWTP
ncbi:Histidine kinase [Saccharopolyspora antimicrobica]|uniref:histidine kinase n=1 Tax=Saccharopolyspora antimicrobica TaxID=455193 RepID=A0A1I4QLW5_9PSEU|nr:histidine kinase [Saccharopolyspora antimicrobica]SFM40746.1 Histidine kinase [Saccharopolyspora antimicrobica]